MAVVLPGRQGRNTHIETVLYETDRENQSRTLIPSVTSIRPDWDIDRAGSKGRIEIEASQRVLRDGMWVAPHLVITPEIGDVVEQQLGHFRMGLPSITADGATNTFGEELMMQQAVGDDIAQVLVDATLPWTFYTPRGGDILKDVRNLIKIATCGAMGPNLVSNGGFEDGMTDWLSDNSAAGDDSTITRDQTSTDLPEGRYALRIRANSGATNAQYRRVYQSLDIPNTAKYLYMSGIAYQFVSRNFDIMLQARIVTPDGITYITADGYTNQRNGWIRHFGVIEMPDDWSDFQVGMRIRPTATSSPLPSQSHVLWDDIQVGTCTQIPLSDSRINLSTTGPLASSRIQTIGGASIGVDAINADRLAAAGHRAIYADLTGILTTTRTRSLSSGTASRTYTTDDYRFVGMKEVQRSASNRYNTVTAVKESFEDDVEPITVTVWNDDPDDAFSVQKLGNVRYPGGVLSMPDAVDSDALEAAALATLARATEQHELFITVLYDPTLSIHDIIEVTGGMEETQGRWMIQYIRPGTSMSEPTVEVYARRFLNSVGVSHG